MSDFNQEVKDLAADWEKIKESLDLPKKRKRLAVLSGESAKEDFWDDQETSGSGTASTHSTNSASVTLAVSGLTSGTRVRQSKRRFNYQSGKSMLVMMTGILGVGGNGIISRIGFFDGNNGLFFENNAGVAKVVRRTKVSGSSVDITVAQTSWNLDPMDGTGNSGVTLNLDNVQIFVIDFEWLGSGRVRFGFNIAGETVYCHQMLNANVLSTVYMSTPNLPVRYEISNDGSGALSSVVQICSTVMSEGGQQDTAFSRYASTNGTHLNADVADTVYALIGIRLKSAYIGATVNPTLFSIISETNDDFEWLFIFNPTVAGIFTYVDESVGATQIARGATENTVTGGTPIFGGWVKSSQPLVIEIKNALVLGSFINGTVDTFVLCVRPLSANADIQGSVQWRELL